MRVPVRSRSIPQTLDAGNLNAKYDVLVFVDGGIPEREAARRRQRWRRLRRLSRPPTSIPAEFRGWLGRVTVAKTVAGAQEVRRERRHRSLTIGSSTSLGHHLGLPLRERAGRDRQRRVTRPLPREKYYVPGSILEARSTTRNPLAYGMDEQGDGLLRRARRSVCSRKRITRGVKPVAVVRQPRHRCEAGWAWGQQYLDQAVSIVDAPVGKGRVVLFGNEVLWRGAAARHVQDVASTASIAAARRRSRPPAVAPRGSVDAYRATPGSTADARTEPASP